MVHAVARKAVVATGVVAAALAAGCGGEDAPAPSRQGSFETGDPGAVHVHGLGINPKDGALFVATHTGLFRAAKGERKASRVADRYQDTMGFTVVGPDRFLGSGHPDGREALPPFLGLIESRDAGRTWRPVSLLGERDFHVLEARGRHVYGYGSDFESQEAALLVSADGGRSWEERQPPEPLLSLAIDPNDADVVVASGTKGLYTSTDSGETWRPIDGPPGLVAWPTADRLFAIDEAGRTTVSGDRGRRWQEAGDVDGQPAAFFAQGPSELYVALHDGSVKRSTDGGSSWSLRSAP